MFGPTLSVASAGVSAAGRKRLPIRLMVSQHHALSDQVFEQRFNVAASRARDRMYLVRSVKLAELSMTERPRGPASSHR